MVKGRSLDCCFSFLLYVQTDLLSALILLQCNERFPGQVALPDQVGLVSLVLSAFDDKCLLLECKDVRLEHLLSLDCQVSFRLVVQPIGIHHTPDHLGEPFLLYVQIGLNVDET